MLLFIYSIAIFHGYKKIYKNLKKREDMPVKLFFFLRVEAN